MHDIRPFLPELFTNPGTLLYIGARVDAHSWLEELLDTGHQVTILEVWPENAKRLVEWFGNTVKVICENIQYLESKKAIFKHPLSYTIKDFDYIFYWHGPEHLPMPEIEPTLQKLEAKCNRLIALACPWGIYPQGAHVGSPFEVHQSTLYPGFFQVLGYSVRVDGGVDKAGSEIVAWKVMNGY